MHCQDHLVTQIAAMVTALDEVYQALVVDKSALQALVDDQDDLIEANYAMRNCH